MNKTELYKNIEPLVEQVVTLQKSVRDIQLVPGENGKDADPAEVAKHLVDDYLQLVRGPAGDPADNDAIAKALMASTDFIALVKGEPGQDGKSVDASDVAKVLIDEHLDLIRGPKGEDADEIEIEIDAIAKSLCASPDFIELVKGAPGDQGKPGEPACPQQVADILAREYTDLLKGDKGDDAPPLDLEAVETRLKSDTEFVTRLKGEPGTDGKDGIDGEGIDVPVWNGGVHREQKIVQHHFGKYYRAVSDTASEPGTDDTWQRVGLGGFEWKGVRDKDGQYENGDLYIDNGSTFLYLNGKGRMFAQRGRDGKDGERGLRGYKGKDAPVPVAIEVVGDKLFMAMDSGEVLECSVKGLAEYLDLTMDEKILSFWDRQQAEMEKLGVPFRVYRGTYRKGEKYNTGDACNFNKALYLALKPNHGESLDSDNWVRIAGASRGGGGSSKNTAITPPANRGIMQTLVWNPGTSTVVNPAVWVDAREQPGVVDVPADLLDRGKLPLSHLVSGKLVYVKSEGMLYEYAVGTNAPTNTMDDWKPIVSSVTYADRMGDLPTKAVDGQLFIVRMDINGEPLNRLITWDEAATDWVFANRKNWVKTQATDPDQGSSQQPGDLQLTTQNNAREIDVFSQGAWQTVYSEAEVKAWIAAGSQFQGTAQETGHGVAGAIELPSLPGQSTLAAGDKSHYWIWVGSPAFSLPAGSIGGEASAIDGSALSVGDWLIVAETGAGTGVFEYRVIPGDLMSRTVAKQMFSLQPFATGAWPEDSVTVYNGDVYRAAQAVLATDPVPDDPASPWEKIDISGGWKVANDDGGLPATAPSGQIWLVLSSATAGGGQGLFSYDVSVPGWQQLSVSRGGVNQATYVDATVFNAAASSIVPTAIGDTLAHRTMDGGDAFMLGGVSLDGATWHPLAASTLARNPGQVANAMTRGGGAAGGLLIDMFTKAGQGIITHVANDALDWVPVSLGGSASSQAGNPGHIIVGPVMVQWGQFLSTSDGVENGNYPTPFSSKPWVHLIQPPAGYYYAGANPIDGNSFMVDRSDSITGSHLCDWIAIGPA